MDKNYLSLYIGKSSKYQQINNMKIIQNIKQISNNIVIQDEVFFLPKKM